MSGLAYIHLTRFDGCVLVVAENRPGIIIEDCPRTEYPAIIDGPEGHPFAH